MKRYYYTDPLAAAWMAKHFGMEFNDPITGRIQPEDIGSFLYSRGEVHPDSLHLLEPKDGDVCELRGDDHNFSNISGDFAEVYIDYVGYDNPVAISLNALAELRDGKDQIARIIQRNGIAFMWPESEEI